MEKRTEWGQTVIHDEVLAALASRAAMAVPGVVQMSHHGLAGNLNSLVRHEVIGRGVRVTEGEEGHYSVDLYIVVQYGVKISQLGRQVADSVQHALKEAVDLYPDQMIVHVEGVRAIEG